MTSTSTTTRPSPWPYRLALATLFAAVPLVVFGGSVTSLEAGMAIEGWWVLEPGKGDHFLFFFPLEKWFRDAGTFVEHTHRLLGSLVGLLSIATVVVTLIADSRPLARGLAFGGLFAVSFQGLIGGLRVLENSPNLAFLHGAIGQAVFATLAITAVVLNPRWRTAAKRTDEASLALRKHALTTALTVYVTIFFGAWLRHGSSGLAFLAHALGVLASIGLLLGLIARIQDAGRTDLAKAKWRLIGLLGAQVLLGLASFWIVFFAAGTEANQVHQSVFPTLHVLFGALLLAQTAAIALWAGRRAAPESPPLPERTALKAGMEGVA